MTGGKGEPGKTGQPVSMRSSFFFILEKYRETGIK